MINNEINPKLIDIIKERFQIFTKGTGKMDSKANVPFISRVTTNKISEGEKKVVDFIKDYDKDNKGYLNEEEFI